jgi:hypothetical protein
MKLFTALVTTPILGALLALLQTANAQAAQAPAASCSPVGDLSFVCGLTNVEDFLPIEGGRWLVGGSYKTGGGGAGLYLIDTAAKTAEAVELSIAAKPDKLYAGCAAPDLKNLTTHGLDVSEGHGVTTVWAVNHGGRESVEVFHLQPAKGTAEWIGCAILPAGTSGNSIVHLPKGAFAVTKFLDTGDKQAFQHIMAGEVNGVVYLWTPGGKGFSEIQGTKLSGDNGIAASLDGKWLYVNAYGSKEVYRVALSGKSERSSVKVDFNPDNLRWAPDGKLFVTGQFINPQAPPGSAVRHGWATVRLDPQTMTVTPVVKEAGLAEFDDATSAVQAGNTLWFGTFRGDRVAYRAAP